MTGYCASGAVGLADVVRLRVCYPEIDPQVWRLLCQVPEITVQGKETDPNQIIGSTSGNEPTIQPPQPTTGGQVKFLAVLACAPVKPTTWENGPDPRITAAPPATRTDLASHGRAPSAPELIPWRQLWPTLRQILGHLRPGHRIDERRLIRQVSAGLGILTVPRLPRRRWTPTARLILDFDSQARTLWGDLRRLRQQIEDLRGTIGLDCWCLVNGGWRRDRNQSQEYQQAPPGVPVLLVSALGPSAGQNLQKVRAGPENPVLALVPDPHRLGETQKDWSRLIWDRTYRILPGNTAKTESTGLTRLLQLSSVAVELEPGLIRRLRLLLGADADVSTEVKLWQTLSGDACVRVMDPVDRAKYRAGLQSQLQPWGSESRRLVDGLVAALQLEHASTSPAFLAEELATLRALLPDEVTTRPDILTAIGLDQVSTELWLRVASLFTSGGALPGCDLACWLDAVIERLPPEVRGRPEIATAWAWVQRRVKNLGLDEILPPEGIRIEQIAWVWEVGVGGSWEWVVTGSEVRARLRLFWNEGGLPIPPRGSPLWFGETERSAIEVVTRSANGQSLTQWWDLFKGKTLSIPDQGTMILRSRYADVTIGYITKPSWATAMGRDRYGLWAVFTIKDVTFRLRWIPPGTFLMGSPADEPGRNENEGPQHRVTLTKGFWLAETPCTQAQWQAVMGTNPSLFQTPARPVEQVSWNNCQKFCEKLNLQVPDLGGRLPSEAEWEYACRAGTTTALYTGPIEILGENNAPALDPIAWYGGNSGVEGESGINGDNSSDWKEKQYEHRQAATHPVGLKQPNPWGLYDMLGNVWEWCQDSFGAYQTDDHNLSEPGHDMACVVRGGSSCHCLWLGGIAKNCRCACWDWNLPNNIDGNQGFRLCIGQSGQVQFTKSGGSRNHQVQMANSRIQVGSDVRTVEIVEDVRTVEISVQKNQEIQASSPQDPGSSEAVSGTMQTNDEDPNIIDIKPELSGGSGTVTGGKLNDLVAVGSGTVTGPITGESNVVLDPITAEQSGTVTRVKRSGRGFVGFSAQSTSKKVPSDDDLKSESGR